MCARDRPLQAATVWGESRHWGGEGSQRLVKKRPPALRQGSTQAAVHRLHVLPRNVGNIR